MRKDFHGAEYCVTVLHGVSQGEDRTAFKSKSSNQFNLSKETSRLGILHALFVGNYIANIKVLKLFIFTSYSNQNF